MSDVFGLCDTKFDECINAHFGGEMLFVVAGAFQLFDGAQSTLLGALRGINDVTKPMKYSFLSYILFAIPMAYCLGFLFGFGPCGILSGEALGLMLAALLYYRRLRKSTSAMKL